MYTPLFTLVLWLTALSGFAQKNAAAIKGSVNKADIEAVTGMALKEPTFEDVDFGRNTYAHYKAVKPRPMNLDVCTISLGLLDRIMYANQLKVDKGMTLNIGRMGQLPGLGDEAFWYDTGQTFGAYTKIGVRKGGRYLSVTLSDSKPGLPRLEAAKQLINKLLPAL